jgi:hypothetical protein
MGDDGSEGRVRGQQVPDGRGHLAVRRKARPRTDSARRGFLDALESDERGFFLGWKAEVAAARVVDAETAGAKWGATGSEERDGPGWERDCSPMEKEEKVGHRRSRDLRSEE